MSVIGVNKSEAIEVMKEDVDALASIVIPDVHEYAFPPILLSIWDKLVSTLNSEERFPKLALGIPRGHAKTTLVKLFVIFCIIFSRKRFILVVCSTSSLAENFIADIADMLDSPNVKALFGDWRAQQTKDRADLKVFEFCGRPITLAAIGAQGNFRGLNLKHQRPDIMIFEDAQSKKCAESITESKAFISWFPSAIKGKSPKGCTFIYVGNMYKEMVLEYDDHGDPAVRSCMLHNLALMEEWTSYISGAILADGTTLWEELHSLDTLLKELIGDQKLGQESEWYAEVQNDPSFQADLKFDPNEVLVIGKNEEKSYGLPHSGYVVVDPSTGKKKSDIQAVGHFFVYDDLPVFSKLFQYKIPQPLMVEQILTEAIDAGIAVIFVEDNGPQGALTQWFEYWMQEKGITGIEVLGINKGKMSKTAAIIEYMKILLAKQQLLTKEISAHVFHQIEHYDPTRTNNVDDVLDVGGYGSRIWGNPDARVSCRLPIDLHSSPEMLTLSDQRKKLLSGSKSGITIRSRI